MTNCTTIAFLPVVFLLLAVASPAAAQGQWFEPGYEYEHWENDGVGYETVAHGYHKRTFAPIHAAAGRGDVSTIIRELAEGVPVDLPVGGVRDWQGDTTPLMWAALFGRVEAVRFLLEAGANVNVGNYEGMTALMAAAGAIRTVGGDPATCVELLLAHGAKPDVRDTRGWTAVMYASSLGFEALRGVARMRQSEEMMHESIRQPDLFLVLRPNIGGSGPIPGPVVERTTWRGWYGDAQRVRMLLDAGADVNASHEPGRAALWAAAAQADYERVRLLLDAGGVVSADALERAAMQGTGEIFKMLLDAYQYLPEEDLQLGVRSIMMRAAAGFEDGGVKVQALIEAGADVLAFENEGRTLLRSAIHSNNDGTAIIPLLKEGVDPATPLWKDDTLLMGTAADSRLEAMQAALERGFDPNERPARDGRPTPLILAAMGGRDASAKVRVLLEAGADIEATADDGGGPLLHAARAGSMDAVIALVKAGADANVVDGPPVAQENSVHWRVPGVAGMTPLMYIAMRGADHLYMSSQRGGPAARALIAAGADVHAVGPGRRTAFDLALKHNQADVMAALLEAGALPEGAQHRRWFNVVVRKEMLKTTIDEGDTASLQVLFDHGVNPEGRVAVEEVSVPPLIHACKRGDIAVIRTLLDAGADVNRAGNGGVTPLIATVQRAHAYEVQGAPIDDLLQLLLERGAEVDGRDRRGRTPIMHLCETVSTWSAAEEAAVLQWLIDAGGDVNARDTRGRRPLHYAGLAVWREPIDVLLQAGAELDAIDDEGRTAIDAAREFWQPADAAAVPALRRLEESFRADG